jgi:hypothetical protein
MKIPSCFVKTKIDGEKMHVWRPKKEELWIKEPIGTVDPVWKQIIRELCLKPFCPYISDMDNERVLFNVVRIRMLSQDKQELVFSISVNKTEHNFELCLFSPVFGETNDIDFEVSKTGIEVRLPWDNRHDFEHKDPSLTESQKHEMVISQALYYMTTWFGDDISCDVLVDVEEVNEKWDDEKDYTFMDPWIFELPSKVLARAHCIKHESEITFMISEAPKKRKREMEKIEMEKE